jgi:PIN domain nuclease of toxin-antitoxin system
MAAVSAARLPGFHGDPADRLIYATARELGVSLVSKDSKIQDYARERGDVEVLW